MKKKSRSLSSLIFVFILLLQAAGISAGAAEPVTGEEGLVHALYTPDENGDPIPVTAQDEGDLLGGKQYYVRFGSTDIAQSTGGGFQLKDLMHQESSLVVGPPEGYYVSHLFISPLGFDEETEPNDLLEDYAQASPSGAEISIPGKVFISSDSSFNTDLLTSVGSEEQVYTLYIQIDEIDVSPITVSYSAGAAPVEIEIPESDAVVEGGISVRSLSEASLNASLAAKKLFAGWLMSYQNKAGVIVEPGVQIAPYESVQLTAQWEDIPPVVITADNASAVYGDIVTPTFTVSPEELIDSSCVSSVLIDADGNEIQGPLAVGEYTIRLQYTGETPYDIEYQDGLLTVTSRPLTVSAKPPVSDDGVSYRADGFECSGLLEGDTISEVTVSEPELQDGKYVCTPSGGGILNTNGEDVTANYEISYTAGEAEAVIPEPEPSVDPGFENGEAEPSADPDSDNGEAEPSPDPAPETSPQPVSITLKAEDRTAEYSGTLIIAEDYELIAGQLAEGDRIESVSYSGGAVNVTSSATSEIDGAKIVNEAGEDVTGNYEISYEPGLVVVTRRAMSVSVKELTKIYDGSKFELSSSDLSVSGLLSGDIKHELRVNFQVFSEGQIVDAIEPGQYTVSIASVQITDAGGADVTNNYDITTGSGTLTIDRAEGSVTLTVTADSGSWVYDGTAHTADSYTVSGLVDGDAISSVIFDEGSNTITDAGTQESRILSVIVLDRDNRSADYKYDVVLIPGTLTVSKAPLTLTAESASKEYDGKPLENKNVAATKLANSGHKLSVRFDVFDAKGNSTKAIEVGSYTKKVTNYLIMDKDTDVTANYKVTLVDGTLTVNPSTTSKNIGNPATPDTGDEANLGLWIGLLAGSAVLIAVMIFFVVKNKKKKDE